ncbi:MAG: Holliday junction resolvase RuvX [Ktedonobacteraceae bacterium]|nr:Holliday junction resolvase RuvX [Ktedonobacteraceae bacterium]
MTRLMALDVGAVRIGVAVSDASRLLASPYTTLQVSRDEMQTWTALQRLIEETEAEGLVIGLPISLDGQIHAQGQRIQEFAARLKAHITIPLIFWDERLSTVEARRLLAEGLQDEPGARSRRGGRQHSQGRRRKSRQGIDALAATVILQEYLDHLRSKTEDSKI